MTRYPNKRTWSKTAYLSLIAYRSMSACVYERRRAVVEVAAALYGGAFSNKFTDCREHAFRRVGDQAEAALGNPLEAHEMRRQGRRLSPPRIHRITRSSSLSVGY
jgi:hypothetical protein